MMKKEWIVLIPLLVVACQKSPGAYEQGAAGGSSERGGTEPGGTEPAGTDGVPGADRPEEPSTNGMPGQMPGDGMGEMGHQMGVMGGMQGLEQQPGAQGSAVQTLQQDVAAMRSAAELQHTDLAKTLRDLSAALQDLPESGATLTDAVSRIGSYADRIEAAGATSNMQVRWAQRALSEGVDALATYQTARGLTGMTERVEGLRTQVAQLNPDQPLAQQREAFVSAFEQLSGVLTDAATPTLAPGTR